MNKIYSIVEGDLNKVRQALKAVSMANNCKSKLTPVDIKMCEAIDILDHAVGKKPDIIMGKPCPECGNEMIMNPILDRFTCTAMFCHHIED